MPDDPRIAIKRGHDAKALRGKSLVAQQSPAHVSDADHRDGPLAIGPQNAADFRDQLGAPVADARMAKMAEIGEIFPHLGIGKAKQRRQLAGADRRPAGSHQMLQLAQIQAQTADDNGRNLAGICGRFLLRRPQASRWDCEMSPRGSSPHTLKETATEGQVAVAARLGIRRLGRDVAEQARPLHALTASSAIRFNGVKATVDFAAKRAPRTQC